MIRFSTKDRFARPGSGPRAFRPRRRAPIAVEPLESRKLLTAIVFADNFGMNSVTGQTVTPEAIAMDADGNSYVAGDFTGTVNLGGLPLTSLGNSDVFVAKLSSNGVVLWAKRMGSNVAADGDFGRGIALDAAGNVYVSGIMAGSGDFVGFNLTSNGGRDAFVVKLNNAGVGQWATSFGGPGNDAGQGIATDGSSVFVTGSFRSVMNFGLQQVASAGLQDAFVIKLDAGSGGFVWGKNLGGAGDDQGFGIGLDAFSNVTVTGDFSSTAAFGPVVLNSAGSTDAFVAKLTSAGAVSWAKGFGGPGHDDGVALSVDPNGNVVFTGDIIGTANFQGIPLTSQGTAGEFNIFLAKLRPDGTILWAKRYGGADFSTGFGVDTDLAGNIYTTGVFRGTATIGSTALTSQGAYDVYVAKLDPGGVVTSANSFGSAGDDQVFQIAVAKPGANYAIVGTHTSAANDGTGNLGAAGGGFVLKSSPSRAESDFLGLGYTQPSVFRPSTSSWYVQAVTGGQLFGAFGAPNLSDIPTAGTYDAAAHAEMAVFRPSNSAWFASGTGGGFQVGTFGAPNLSDIPVPGDYDGTGKTELAVFRPSTSQWFVLGPTGGRLLGSFGAPNLFDIPVPGDYDGTGHTEMAVFRPSTGQWFVFGPTGGRLLGTFGATNLAEIPVPGDYDRTGHTQLAVFKQSTSEWFVLGATGRRLLTTFGAPNFIDFPTQAPVGALKALASRGLHAAGVRGGSGGGVGLHDFAVAPPSTVGASNGPAPNAKAVPKTATGLAASPLRTSMTVRQAGGRATKVRNDVWSAALHEVAGA